MPAQYFELRDAKNAGLHDAMSRIEHELARLSLSTANANIGDLRGLWGSFVGLLALDPAHEVRECPHCKHVAMRAATRCGNCWTKLAPNPALETPTLETTIVRGSD